uniref:DC29 n=1 Tax=Homo sapiens TaxID=9606 RepID=Q9H2N0_HUMAN|nr:DC29 [Homo sapiens]
MVCHYKTRSAQPGGSTLPPSPAAPIKHVGTMPIGMDLLPRLQLGLAFFSLWSMMVLMGRMRSFGRKVFGGALSLRCIGLSRPTSSSLGGPATPGSKSLLSWQVLREDCTPSPFTYPESSVCHFLISISVSHYFILFY